MEHPRDKYYTELFRAMIDFNNRNDAPLYNENIRYTINRVITEEESYAHNITLDAHKVTVDSFSQTSNIQK